MKKSGSVVALLFLCIFLHFQKTFAQQVQDSLTAGKWNASASYGYGIGLNGDFVYYFGNSPYITTLKTGNGWYGKLSGGYQINNRIGVEFSAGYMNGITNTYKPVGYPRYYNSSGQYNYIIPTLVFASHKNNSGVYLKSGVIIAEATFYTDSRYFENNNTIYKKVKYSGGLSMGLQNSVGYLFNIRKSSLQLYLQADFNSLVMQPSRSTVYSYTINGIDRLPSLSTGEKEMNFKDEASANGQPKVQNTPTDLLQTAWSFGAVVFNAGIRLKLGHKNISENKSGYGDRFYIRAQTGPGIMIDPTRFINMINDSSASIVKFSGGAGMNFGAGIGLMTGRSYGFDLGFNFVSSPAANYKTQVVTPIDTFPSHYLPPGSKSVSGEMWQMNPDIVIAQQIGKFSLYERAGLIIGSGTVYSDEDCRHLAYNTITHSNDTVSIHMLWKKDGSGVSLGYNAALGLTYPIRRNLDLYAELVYNNIYDIPATAKMIAYTVNGTDALNGLSEHYKNETFWPHYLWYDNADQLRPVSVSSEKFSFCSLVFNFGIRIRF